MFFTRSCTSLILDLVAIYLKTLKNDCRGSESFTVVFSFFEVSKQSAGSLKYRNAHLHKTQILGFVMRQLPAGPEPLTRATSCKNPLDFDDVNLSKKVFRCPSKFSRNQLEIFVAVLMLKFY